MRVHAGAFALLAPGLASWAEARPVLAGQRDWQPATLSLPPPPGLPPAERRRTSPVVRLAMAAADATLAASGLEPRILASLFASSNGDGEVVGGLLATLATTPRDVSPTQFHKSVHNTPAAFWAIAHQAMGPSTSIGCHDDTVPMALLEAAATVAAEGAPLLLCAYDMPLPRPLGSQRPTSEPFAFAMMVTREPAPFSEVALRVRFASGAPGHTAGPEVPALRPLVAANPIARSLPLLEAVARREPAVVELPCLGDARVVIEVAPT